MVHRPRQLPDLLLHLYRAGHCEPHHSVAWSLIAPQSLLGATPILPGLLFAFTKVLETLVFICGAPCFTPQASSPVMQWLTMLAVQQFIELLL